MIKVRVVVRVDAAQGEGKATTDELQRLEEGALAAVGATGYDIRRAFLGRTGAKITPPGEFDIHAGASDQTTPAVTTNEEKHGLVEANHLSGIWGIIVARLRNANGTLTIAMAASY